MNGANSLDGVSYGGRQAVVRWRFRAGHWFPPKCAPPPLCVRMDSVSVFTFDCKRLFAAIWKNSVKKRPVPRPRRGASLSRRRRNCKSSSPCPRESQHPKHPSHSGCAAESGLTHSARWICLHPASAVFRNRNAAQSPQRHCSARDNSRHVAARHTRKGTQRRRAAPNGPPRPTRQQEVVYRETLCVVLRAGMAGGGAARP